MTTSNTSYVPTNARPAASVISVLLAGVILCVAAPPEAHAQVGTGVDLTLCVDSQGHALPRATCDHLRKTVADPDNSPAFNASILRSADEDNIRDWKRLQEEQAAARRAANAPQRSREDTIRYYRACIADTDREIARQREIGRETGVVDKVALYQAGSLKVSCKHQLEIFMGHQAP